MLGQMAEHVDGDGIHNGHMFHIVNQSKFTLGYLFILLQIPQLGLISMPMYASFIVGLI